jgi:predicted RNA-binding Zn ribbon-like protein
MPHKRSSSLIAGSLALDFANTSPMSHDLSWDEFVSFLLDAKLVTPARAAKLRPLLLSEPQAVDAILLKILRLREAFRAVFGTIVERKPFPRHWADPINEILRVTEGHDELVPQEDGWRLQFIAREEGLEWLLAAIARSAAELRFIRLAVSPEPKRRSRAAARKGSSESRSSKGQTRATGRDEWTLHHLGTARTTS